MPSLRVIPFRFATVGQAPFDRCSFFVIVPGGDQSERNGMRGLIVLLKQAESIFECLSTARIDVPVQTPGSLRVVETGPNSAYRNLIGTFAHLRVEFLQVILAPRLTVRLPPAVTRIHPCVLPVEGFGELRRRSVLGKKRA